MCAVATSAKQITKQDRPRTKIRNELSAYWVDLALKHSGKTPQELAASLKGVPINRLSEGERIKYERYAEVNSDGSMDILELKRFVREARKLNLLPQRSGLHHTSEHLFESEDQEDLIEDSKRLLKHFENKRAALIKALEEYADCFKNSYNGYSGINVLDTESTNPSRGEDDDDYVPEVFEADIRKLAKQIKGHQAIQI